MLDKREIIEPVAGKSVVDTGGGGEWGGLIFFAVAVVKRRATLVDGRLTRVPKMSSLSNDSVQDSSNWLQNPVRLC